MELAAAKLAISILSPIINKLGSFVYESYLGGDVTAEEMKKLTHVFLPKIKMVLQEAELVHPDGFRRWLDDLQEAAFEAEDLIDLYEYEKIKYKVSSLPEFVKKLKNKTKETLGSMLPKSSFKVSFEKLQKSAEEAENLLPFIKSARRQLKYKNPQSSTGTGTGSTLPSCIFGREEECDIVIKFLLEESHADSNRRIEKIPIIAIKGIGGSGKTTTAQSVYNDERVRIFDLKMWVHVSRSFDVHRLTKEIIESAVKGECPHISNLDVLQTKLKESIPNGKKFLLVLDDIWCEDKMQWDQLLSPLNGVKGNGNKIIITTRMEKVTSILHVDQVVSLQELKMNDCWSILKHYAFGDSETTIEDRELEEIGNQIISKVKYSPLALKVVGSLLYKQVSVSEWEDIFRKDILKETMDVLLLSFQHLPSHLQRCFAYCSLFPKGYKFYTHKEELVPLWIAQGFVENINETETTLKEKGQNYIKDLLSYSFFEIDNDYFNGSYHKTHDLLHDLAEKVSKKYCHRIEDDSSNIPPTCIHLLVNTENLSMVNIADMLKSNNLRTLIILNEYSKSFKNIKEQFSNPTKLRALYVEPSLEIELVLSGDKLKHLRYLNLKYDEKLHRSLLAKLYHLQFLYCYGCPIIKGEDIFLECRVQRGFVQGFDNLINLRTLKLYDERIALDYCELPPSMSNKSLCHTEIEIQRCARNKSRLFNDLPFLTNLEKLRLEGFSNLQTFPNLSSTVTDLEIVDFPNLTILGNLQNCTSLKILRIKKCPMLMRDESIFVDGDITLGLPCSIKVLKLDGSCRQFPLLLEGILHHLSSLRELWLEGFTTLPSLEKLSSLKRLVIIDCPGVVFLPSLPISLQEIERV